MSPSCLRRDPPARSFQRGQRGASFVELMLAILVISTTVVASTASLRSSTEVYHFFADGAHESLMLAQEIHEAALLMPWDADDDAEPVFGSDVYSLYDLHEKEYSPPRSADYDLVASHLGWSQSVEVCKVDMDDPSIVILDPESYTGEMLTELKVTVLNDGVEVGAFSWWMTEPTGD